MEQLPTLLRNAPTADAIRSARNRWQMLTRYLDDGEVEIGQQCSRVRGRPVQPDGEGQAQWRQPGGLPAARALGDCRLRCQLGRRAVSLDVIVASN